eukprot:6201287-Alexandrium_andersonii.AAC.1
MRGSCCRIWQLESAPANAGGARGPKRCYSWTSAKALARARRRGCLRGAAPRGGHARRARQARAESLR